MIHSALMRAVGDGPEHVDGLQARLVGDARRVPEALHAVAMRRVVEVHMGGERVGEAADLAAAHGVGLAGDRERAHAGPADAAGREMAVDDRVDLVGAVRRLVDALAVDGDRALGVGEQREERGQVGRRRGRQPRRRRQGRGAGGRRQRLVEAAGMRPRCSRGRARRVAPEMRKQPVEQRDVAARTRSPDAGRRSRRSRCGADRSRRPSSPAARPARAAMRW